MSGEQTQTAASPWKHRSMMVLALVFIGGEGLVQLGVKLPLSDVVPEWASGLIGALLMAGGAYFRQKLVALMADH